MTNKQPQTYRQQFSGKERAAAYDRNVYGSDSYCNQLWQIEQRQLLGILEEFHQSHSHIEYLDFACGTGRIIAGMQDHVDRATGIEISESMAEVAREKSQKATIYCRDITQADETVEGKYDFITSFRFVLNAETSLRVSGMKALVDRLRDKTSLLVINNHGNFWSHKLLMWPIHTLRNIGKPRRLAGNYMTHAEVVKLADEVGLEIVRVLGCGVIGGRLAKFMAHERVIALESRLSNTWMARLGVNQMYVARLK